MIESKPCTVCNKPMTAKTVTNGNLNQKGNFSRQKYCSAACRMKEWTRTGGMKWRKLDAQRHPEKWLRYRKDVSYKRAYGITYDKYMEMHDSQNGLCAICNKPEKLIKKGIKYDLSIDHCHGSGKIRGLLCNNCNRAIGLMKDDPAILQSAVDYLMMHHGK